MTNKLKLYLWVDFGDDEDLLPSSVCAIAKSEKDAKDFIIRDFKKRTGITTNYSYFRNLSIIELEEGQTLTFPREH